MNESKYLLKQNNIDYAYFKHLICHGEEIVALFHSKEDADNCIEFFNAHSYCNECGNVCENFKCFCNTCDTIEVRSTYCSGCECKKPCDCNYEEVC